MDGHADRRMDKENVANMCAQNSVCTCDGTWDRTSQHLLCVEVRGQLLRLSPLLLNLDSEDGPQAIRLALSHGLHLYLLSHQPNLFVFKIRSGSAAQTIHKFLPPSQEALELTTTQKEPRGAR